MTTNPERELHEYISEISERTDVRAGSPLPLGTQERAGGVNFALFSRHASRVRLEFFDHPKHNVPARVIDLDSARNRTGDVWHVWVAGIGPGQLYAYRVDGPYEPGKGHRFNFNRLLLDPLATAISRLPPWDFASARGYDPSAPEQDLVLSTRNNSTSMPKCVWVNEPFDWQADQPPRHPWSKTVIYEMHVRGFTIHPTSGVNHPGTYRGLMEKIPYLKSLGVTAVELMPVQEFNDGSVTRKNPQTTQPLKNYWGYDPVVFCAAKASYSSSGGSSQQKLEFKEMIRAFHKAGIEVILDVVFNHTAEGDELGPTLCFRGMDNAIFYTLADDKRHYKNYTGTGNTINANHPVVRDHILAALRYWMVEMHVDGFRFDLASVLGRDRTGKLLANALLLERIAEDPILRDVKIRPCRTYRAKSVLLMSRRTRYRGRTIPVDSIDYGKTSQRSVFWSISMPICLITRRLIARPIPAMNVDEFSALWPCRSLSWRPPNRIATASFAKPVRWSRSNARAAMPFRPSHHVDVPRSV